MNQKTESAASLDRYPAGLPDYPSILHALQVAAERAPDRVALVCEQRQISWREYLRAVAGLAGQLRQVGAAGQRVAVLMDNSIEAAVASVGGMAAGAQVALLNPNYTPRELDRLLADAAPRVLLCNDTRAESTRELAAASGVPEVLALGPDAQALDEWTGDAALALPEPLPAADDLALMFFTGGTTGLPKGVNHTHRMLTKFCQQVMTLLLYEFDAERMLGVAPMFHIFGHHYTNVLPIYLRGSMVIVPRYKPEIVLEALQRHRITVFSGGPAAIYTGLLGAEQMATTDFSQLRYSLSGGAPCPEYLVRTWEERTGSIFLEGYGMSEGAPITNNPARGKRKVLSAGIAPPETDLQIVDLEQGTQVLPTGERGEIRVRGPQITTGYHNRPEETRSALRDGWLYTGDIGYLDEDGYLFIVDRTKDMILVGGFNVYPREVDEVLHMHPAVHEAAAIGVPDEFRGEVVKACVVLREGASASAGEIIDFCAERLVKYKVPHSVQFLDALPKTGARKISRLELRRMHEAGTDA